MTQFILTKKMIINMIKITMTAPMKAALVKKMPEIVQLDEKDDGGYDDDCDHDDCDVDNS